MGYLFQELVRKFNEQANEEAGDHFTPREVIRLMVQLIFTDEKGGTMNRERALKVVLVVVGLFFAAGIYPLITTVRGAWQTNGEDSTPMMLSLYVTLGVFCVAGSPKPVCE
jgi:N-6 DNA methylase